MECSVRIAELANWDQVLVRLIDGRDIGVAEVENRFSAFETLRHVVNLRRESLPLQHEGNQTSAVFAAFMADGGTVIAR